MSISIPRPEFPRPDFERQEWLNLNGEWDFEFDDNNIGETEGWYKAGEIDFSRKITVPFCYQCEMSGINDKSLHEIMWYRRTFNIPESFKNRRVLLNFGAVDYHARVWINGNFAGEHKGGYVQFKFDITNYVKETDNVIVVRVEDRYDTVQPRGKQYWKEKPDRCWYIATSGIWQTVWLEAVGEVNIERIRLTPDIDKRCVTGELHLDREAENLFMEVSIDYKGKNIVRMNSSIKDRITKFAVCLKEEDSVDEIHYWTPETPNLYDVQLTIKQNGKTLDSVKTYFGMRKISVCGDKILLNNKPLYQKLILDQGYWPESLLTPPSDEAIKFDIEMTKKMGFNGARKHQKIEDPRYYYWADKLGLLVWGEMPSAYNFNAEEIENITREWIDFINRDYNHPCIITWVPLNESWGVRNIYTDKNQQNFALALYYIAKAVDGTRLVSTNDGWENVKSDFCSIHDYVAWGDEFIEKYEDKSILYELNNSGRMLFAQGYKYEGQPVIITEYGGIAFESSDREAWGYHEAVKDVQSFLNRYSGITDAIRKTKYIRGYCYTQLTDVMQEINGLLTADRKLKVPLDEIRKINK
ncbi:MAG TPA: glycoside hydrolase family 2 [Clostridiaceae bacterium]|nr:glycoside hydrolase family 2 [Clostridiaceae bacterium]